MFISSSTTSAFSFKVQTLFLLFLKLLSFHILRKRKMANARIARFVTEVAPQQFVSVMRRRTSKVLDTINEEEREVSSSAFTAAAKAKITSSGASSSASFSESIKSKYFLKEVQRPVSIIDH